MAKLGAKSETSKVDEGTRICGAKSESETDCVGVNLWNPRGQGGYK